MGNVSNLLDGRPATDLPEGFELVQQPLPDYKGSAEDPRALIPFIRQTAGQLGIDPDLAVKVATAASRSGLSSFTPVAGLATSFRKRSSLTRATRPTRKQQ